MNNNKFSLGKYYELLDNNKDIYSDEMREYFANQNVFFTSWKDHIAELADVKTEDFLGKDDKGRDIVKHIRHDGNIFQQGTPVNSEHLGQMEWNDAILACQLKIAMDMLRKLSVQVAILLDQNANNMPYNTFVANAKYINEDIELIEGYYDAINERGVV